MTATIDQRIVGLEFDNKNFEKNAKKSLGTLDSLKESLNFKDSAKGLEGLNAAGKKVSFDTMAKSVDTVANRFSTLGVIGMSVIHNLTTSAMNFGRTMTAKILDPLVQGGQTRALNIEAAKFQFKGLGMDVEEAMKSANDAVLGTAYGLDVAAKTAAQFGASGMEAGEDMTKALRGISGVAAMTNSTYEDISDVFTTVAGNGRLMGDELRRLASRGLNVAASLADEFGITEAAVRDLVSKGGVSFEMFYTAMDNAFGEHATSANEMYSGSLANMRSAISRVGQAFAAAKFERQRDLFNAVTPAINVFNKALSPVAKMWNELASQRNEYLIGLIERLNVGSRYLLATMDTLSRTMSHFSTAIRSWIKPIKDAFFEVFSPITGKDIYGVSRAIESFAQKLTLSESVSNKVRETFKGLFSILSIAGKVILSVAKGFTTLVSRITPLGKGVVFVTGGLGSFLSKVNESVKVTDMLSTAVNLLFDAFKPIGELFTNVKKIFPSVLNFATNVTKALEPLTSAVKKIFENFDLQTGFSVLQGGLFAGILIGIEDLINTLKRFVQFGGSVRPRIQGILRTVTLNLEAMENKLKADTLIRIAGAIAILAGAIFVLSVIDPAKLAGAVTAISVLFVDLFASMAVFQKVAGDFSSTKMIALSITMTGMSIAVLLLASAAAKLGKLNWGEIARGLSGVAGMTATLIVAAKVLSANSKAMIKGATGFILFATALVILTKAVSNLGGLDTATLAKGLSGIAVLAAELVLFMKLADTSGMGVRVGVGLVLLAQSLVIFGKAVGQLGSLNFETLAKGLGAMAIVLAQMAIFTKLTGNVKGLIGTSIGMTILASSMLILSKALESMGSLSLETLAKGLGALGISLGIISGAMHLMKGSLPGATALIVVSTALVIFSKALKSVGEMSVADIAKGLITFTAALGGLALAGILIAPVIPALLGLGGAIALIGVGALAVGAGLLAFSAGLTALSVSGAAGVASLVVIITSLVGLIPMIFSQIGKGIANMALVIADSAEAITTLFVAMLRSFTTAIVEASPMILDAAATLMLAFLEKLVEITPKLIQTGVDLLVSFLQGISSNIGRVIEVATDIIVNFIDGIAKSLPRIVDAGFNLIVDFINSLSDSIEENTPIMVDAFFGLADAMIQGLIDGLIGGAVRAVETVKNVGSSIITGLKNVLGIKSPSTKFYEVATHMTAGLVNGLKATQPKVIAATTDLAVTPETDIYKEAGKEAGGSFASGITESKPKAKTAAEKLAEEALRAIRETTKEVSVKEGRYLVDGVIIGMVSKEPDSYEASRFLAEAIQKGLIEEEPRFTGIGETNATRFLKGMTEDEIIQEAWASGVKISSSAWDGAKSTAEQMAAAGTAAGQAYINGLNAAAEAARKRLEDIARDATSGAIARSHKKVVQETKDGLRYTLHELSQLSDDQAKTYWEYGGGVSGKIAVEMGQETSKGLATGIKAGAQVVIGSIKGLTNSVTKTVKDGLGIKSPSRVFMQFGRYTVQGFVNGLSSMNYEVGKTTRSVGDSAVDSLKSALTRVSELMESDLDYEPTIRPVIDLSDVQNGIGSIGKMFDRTNQLALRVSSTGKMGSQRDISQANTDSPNTTPSLSFTQNNYSPKPLSRLDIYRQTKNQFAAVKEVLT